MSGYVHETGQYLRLEKALISLTSVVQTGSPVTPILLSLNRDPRSTKHSLEIQCLTSTTEKPDASFVQSQETSLSAVP